MFNIIHDLSECGSLTEMHEELKTCCLSENDSFIVPHWYASEMQAYYPIELKELNYCGHPAFLKGGKK